MKNEYTMDLSRNQVYVAPDYTLSASDKERIFTHFEEVGKVTLCYSAVWDHDSLWEWEWDEEIEYTI